jgi:hypothetical protein
VTLSCQDVDFDLRIAEFRINGYTVFDDMIAPEKVDAIRDAFLPLLANVQERETEVHDLGERGDPRTGMGRLQTTNRNFWHIDQTIKMPESSYRALSARGKQLLKRYRPVVWD